MPEEGRNAEDSPVKVGDRFSRQHTFTAQEVMAFAELAGDDNPIHHDAALAARTRFGGLIASGTHTSALLLGLTASHFSKRGSVVGVTFSVSLKLPVMADERVTLEWVVADVRPRAGGRGSMVDMTGALTNERGLVCVSATGTVLVGIDLAAKAG